MCSCPPFECTCHTWKSQRSPRLASSPPCPTKRLNFFGPSACDVAAGPSMHSLSIEIGPNQFLNTNPSFDCLTTGMPLQDPAPMDNVNFMSSYPNTSCGTSLYSDSRQYEQLYYNPAESFYRESGDFRSRSFLQSTSGTNFKRQRISGAFPDFIDTDHLQSGINSTGFEPFTKRVKPEVKSEFDNCARIIKDEDCTKSADFSSSNDDLFDVNNDFLNSAFDTDMYSSMLQRIADCQLPDTIEKDKSQTTIPSSMATTTQFAELKPIKSTESKPKPYQEALLATAPKNIEAQFARSYDYMTNMSETSSMVKTSLPHKQSEFFLPDVEPSFQAPTDFDSRFKTSQEERGPIVSKSGQQPYCNHSINITLRYK